ncbi:MAG: hypothetical protein ACR2M1_08510 [Gemmatimonadaceae bacterium]
MLSDVDPDTAQVLLVRLVTYRPYTDKTVTLNVGDHPSVKHASNVDYGSAVLLRADKVDAMVKSGVARFDADMSKDLLSTVRAGLFSSSHTVHLIVDYCRTRW